MDDVTADPYVAGITAVADARSDQADVHCTGPYISGMKYVADVGVTVNRTVRHGILISPPPQPDTTGMTPEGAAKMTGAIEDVMSTLNSVRDTVAHSEGNGRSAADKIQDVCDSYLAGVIYQINHVRAIFDSGPLYK